MITTWLSNKKKIITPDSNTSMLLKHTIHFFFQRINRNGLNYGMDKMANSAETAVVVGETGPYSFGRNRGTLNRYSNI